MRQQFLTYKLPALAAVLTTVICCAPSAVAQQNTAVAPVGQRTYTVITAGELAANPALYWGRRVIVTGEVETKMGNQVFTLDEDRLFAGPDVLVAAPEVAGVEEGTEVTVHGVVHQYVKTDVEREFGWFRATSEIEMEARSRPLLVAESVTGAEGRELMKNPQPAQTTAAPKTQPTQSAATDKDRYYLTDLDTIGNKSKQFIGKNVVVRGKVDYVAGRSAFTLRDEWQGGARILTMSSNLNREMERGGAVVVAGTVRRADPKELERKYGAEISGRMEGNDQPYIEAESIYSGGQELVGGNPSVNARLLYDQGAEKMISKLTSQQQAQQQASKGQQQQASPGNGNKQEDKVRLSNAKVQRVAGERTIVVQPETGEPVAVVIAQDAVGKDKFKQGDTLQVVGVMAPVPQEGAQSNLDPKVLQELKGQDFYLFTTRIQLEPKPGSSGQSGAGQQDQKAQQQQSGQAPAKPQGEQPKQQQ